MSVKPSVNEEEYFARLELEQERDLRRRESDHL